MEQPKLFDDQEQLNLPAHLMEYLPRFYGKEESNHLLECLIRQVPWQQHKVKMYDKEVLTPRLNAWYGDVPPDELSKNNAAGLVWTPELLQLKNKVEQKTGIVFNSVLLNYYRDGNDSVAWHSDKDTLPGRKTEIASVSLGQARSFDFRNKKIPAQKYAIMLESGSLLLMKGDLQIYWEHRIAKSNLAMKPRINLTFRIRK